MVAALIASEHIFSTTAPEYVLNFTVDTIRLTAYNVKNLQGRIALFEYMTVQEVEKKWELSERRVQKLYAENRIDDVVHLSRMWLIPKGAERPIDGRTKQGKEQKHE